MKICLVNAESAWKDKQENLKRAENYIKEALKLFPETQVIVFPELSITGYILDEDNKELAEDASWDSILAIKQLAKKYDVNIIAGFIRKDGDKIFNSSMVVDKKWELITTYDKNHLFSSCPEPEMYNAWESLSVFELEWWKCGLFICFDCRYPRLFEAYKNAWVECIFGIYNWLQGRNKEDMFSAIIKSKSVDNQLFIAWVDCIWSDENASYTWSACISTPYAEDIKITQKDIYHYAELDKQDILSTRDILPMEPSFKENYNK